MEKVNVGTKGHIDYGCSAKVTTQPTKEQQVERRKKRKQTLELARRQKRLSQLTQKQ